MDVPETFVEDYSVQLDKGSQTHINGWVRLNGPRKQQKVTVRIPDAGVSSTVADATGLTRFAIDARLQLWSPENPKLYDVVIEAESDRVEDRLGFRTIEASWQPASAQRQATPFARRVDTRRSALPLGPRVLRSGCSHASALGAGTGLQLRTTAALPARRSDDSRHR